MSQKQKSPLSRLLDYGGKYKALTFTGLFLSAVAQIAGMVPFICVWLVVRDLITVAPNFVEAVGIIRYGWIAFAAATGGILIYFLALMCTHLAAFRTASNIRKQGIAHLMKTSFGFFDSNGSGLLRNKLDNGASETETLLAHNLADISGTAAMFLSTVVLMFVFDWKMGAACLLSVVISILMLCTMMGGKNAKLMLIYQGAQDEMAKAGTEYVRGIPVVKVFQQTVYSFRAFKESIEKYSKRAEEYTDGVCRLPQSVNLTVTEGVFIFLVPAALLLAPKALSGGTFAEFLTDFAFYAVFSAIISTALARIMFASSGTLLARTALARIDTVIGSKGTYLSGGEQQRIALARAILKDAPIVVLDEATAFADPENEELIHAALRRLTKGKTVVMIAHRLSTVVGADKIIVLAGGKIIETGRHEELKDAGGSYAKMWADYNKAAEWKIGA